MKACERGSSGARVRANARVRYRFSWRGEVGCAWMVLTTADKIRGAQDVPEHQGDVGEVHSEEGVHGCIRRAAGSMVGGGSDARAGARSGAPWTAGAEGPSRRSDGASLHGIH